MKRVAIIGFLITLIGLNINLKAGENSTLRFAIGEKLEYSLWFNFIKGGEATMEIVGLERVNGQPAYHLRLVSETSPIFDKIFKVRDYFDSWMDIRGLFSHQFQKNIQERRYRKNYAVRFDYDQQKAFTSNDTVAIKGRMQDALSVIYCVRAENLSEGRIIKLNNFDNNKIKLFNVVVSRTEKISVPAGEFECFVLEPYATEGKLFKYQTDMTIYVSTDSLRLPVLITSTASFGKMVFKLERRSIKF